MRDTIHNKAGLDEVHEIRMGLSFEAIACGMRALAEWEALPDNRRTDANKVAMVYSAMTACKVNLGFKK